MAEDIHKKVEEFFSQYRSRRYDKGQVMIFAGDEPQYIYFIKKGVVRMYDVSYRGDEIVVNVFRPGAFFPMSWAINRPPNEYFYQAAEPVEVCLANPDETVQFLRDNPDVLFNLLSRVYIGTDSLIRRMVHVMGGSAKGRLMYEILTECQRFGKRQPNGSCMITITETELAARTGLSRETVSREVRKLIDEELLTIGGGKITIQNMEHFEARLAKVP